MAAIELQGPFFDFVEKIIVVKTYNLTIAVFCLFNVVTETRKK